VLSVTPEAVVNAAFQAAPHWPVRSDQPRANDPFGALVNHNTQADSAIAPPPPPPQRRAEESPQPADNAGAANAASNQAAGSNPNTNVNAGPSSDINAGNNGPTNAVATGSSQGNPAGVPKDEPAKPVEKSASTDSSSTDQTILVQQAALAATTPNPVAVAIPVIPVPTNVPAATHASGGTTAPLAIAAAAIAASSQAVYAQAAPAAQPKTDSDTTGPTATTTATTTTTTSTVSTIATTKGANSAAASAAIAAPVIPQATQANATPANSAALTSAVAAAAPVAPQETSGKSAATPATDGATTASNAADPSTSNRPPVVAQNGLLQQPPPAAKPESANSAAEAPTADAAAASASAISAHEHSPPASAGHGLADSPDPGTQPIGTFQPQPNTAAIAAAPAGQFTVTAATNAPVPLSGLAVEIAASATSGKSRFEIRLDPADLGRIDVRIDIDRNGQVTSHLTVEKPETLSMLRQDAPQLQRALDDAGLKTGNGGLQFSLRDQSSSGQNGGNDSSPTAQRLIISEEDTIPAAIAGRTYGRSLGSSSGVDIRV